MQNVTVCEDVRDPSRCRFPLSMSSSLPRFLRHPALASTLSNFRYTYPRQIRAVIRSFATREDARLFAPQISVEHERLISCVSVYAAPTRGPFAVIK